MEHLHGTDLGTLYWLCNHHECSALNTLMKGFTDVGDPWTLLCVALAAVALLCVAKRWRTAAILLLTGAIGVGITQSVKHVVKRPRPDLACKLIDVPKSPSFPSGHSLNSMCIYGSMALLAARHLRRRVVRAALLAVGFTLPLAIGVSRPFLGVHYPSDVLAGWTAGLACALLALWLDQRWEQARCASAGSPSEESPFAGASG